MSYNTGPKEGINHLLDFFSSMLLWNLEYNITPGGEGERATAGHCPVFLPSPRNKSEDSNNV